MKGEGERMNWEKEICFLTDWATEGVSCMEWKLPMNGNKVIAIKRLFSKAIHLFKADMCWKQP